MNHFIDKRRRDPAGVLLPGSVRAHGYRVEGHVTPAGPLLEVLSALAAGPLLSSKSAKIEIRN